MDMIEKPGLKLRGSNLQLLMKQFEQNEFEQSANVEYCYELLKCLF